MTPSKAVSCDDDVLQAFRPRGPARGGPRKARQPLAGVVDRVLLPVSSTLTFGQAQMTGDDIADGHVDRERKDMSWGFETDAAFGAQLQRVREFVQEEVEPLDLLWPEVYRQPKHEDIKLLLSALKEQVRTR